jgi:hypothetical protein
LESSCAMKAAMLDREVIGLRTSPQLWPVRSSLVLVAPITPYAPDSCPADLLLTIELVKKQAMPLAGRITIKERVSPHLSALECDINFGVERPAPSQARGRHRSDDDEGLWL